MPNDSLNANKMETELTANIKGHSDSNVLDFVSEILLRIIGELHVFKSRDEDKIIHDKAEAANNIKNEDLDDEGLSSNNTCMHLPEDCYVTEYSKIVEKDTDIEKNETTTNVLDHCLIHSKIQGLVSSKISDHFDQENNNSCRKEKLLSALNLSPVLIDLMKENNVADMNFPGKKKESVHFNSPVAVVYEFSEKSEAVSDDSTEILSDSESEGLTLSQDEHTEEFGLELASGDASSKATYVVNNVHDENLTIYVKEDTPEGIRDSITTQGRDSFNLKPSTNCDVVISPLNNSTSDCNKSAVSPQNFNELLINDKGLGHEEKLENGDTLTLSENIKCKDIEFDKQDTNDAVEISNTKERFYSEKIVPNIDICERNDYKKIGNNQSNLTDKSLVISNIKDPTCVVADLLSLEKKDFCVSDVFAKFSLDKEEKNAEQLQDLFKDLSQSDTIKDEFDVKSENDSFQNINRNDSGQDFDSPVLTKTEEQDLITNTSCKLLQVVIEQDCQDIANECEPIDERREPSQQGIDSKDVSEKVDVFSQNEKNDMTENVLWSGQKREQSSPELYCSQISKKSKSETSINSDTRTKKRKLFRVQMDEYRSVKLLKLDFEHQQSEVNKVPKMLKQLASDVIEGFDDNIIFESTQTEQNHSNKQEDVCETHCYQVTEKSPDNQTLSVTIGINRSTETEMNRLKVDSTASLKGQDKIIGGELCLNDCDKELQQEEHTAFCLLESESKEHSTLNRETNCSGNREDNESYQFETSEVGSLKEGHFPASHIIPEFTEITSSPSSLTQDSGSKSSMTQIESDQSVPVVLESNDIDDTGETASNTLFHLGDDHNTEELAHVNDISLESPTFISAAELLSHNSQESGSTGFTVCTADFQYRCDSQAQISFGNLEVIQSCTVTDLVTEKSIIGMTLQQAFDHEIVKPLIHSPKNMIEITEDGLKEEKLEDSDYVGASVKVQESAESFDCVDKSCVATDQDEQIDTDQLDVHIDRAVDQIVPDDKYDSEIVDKVKQHTMCINNEDKKSKEHDSVQDVCDEEGNTACQQMKTQRQFHEKCFNWKYRPSYDPEVDTHLPELPDEDQVVTITPLKTCGKPLRLGLSKRQPVKKSLHQFVTKK